MSATVIRLVLSCQPKPLQLCPIWTCNNVQKWFATLSKKFLQKTREGYYKAVETEIEVPSSGEEKRKSVLAELKAKKAEAAKHPRKKGVIDKDKSR